MVGQEEETMVFGGSLDGQEERGKSVKSERDNGG